MIPVTNNTKMPIYVGAAMVPAGETRLFHEHEVPVHLRPAPEVAAPEAPKADPVVELAKLPAKEIIAGLDALTNEQLDQLAAIEQVKGDKARSTVLNHISELVLKRAEGGGA
jgi:hypothetical protein